MSLVLGLNAYHADSAACLVVDGKLVAAAEEERFRRIKHWAGFPSQAIAYCLREAGVDLSKVTHVALNTDRRAGLARKVAFTLRHRPDVGLVVDRLRNQKKRVSVQDELRAAFPSARFDGEVCAVEHHLAHLYSAFHVSPFEEAVAVSVDGFGDFASAAWGIGRGQRLRIDGRVYFPHSLGAFYQALTQYLGFPNYGDEYKVMGLAPYGEPRHVQQLREVVRLRHDGTFALNLKYFRHAKENVPYAWSGGTPEVGKLYSPALVDLLGPERDPKHPLDSRHHDIARSVQVVYEEAFFHLLQHLSARYGVRDVAIAGGCGNNSVANGKVTLRTPFRSVYVQSAAGDAGGAIGAALAVACTLSPTPPRRQMPHAYFGPSYARPDIANVLDTHRAQLDAAKCTVTLHEDETRLCSEVAQAIADAKVVGWFQGRMEWGPRALGNRSILGDPRRADMKDILNLKIKRRESFRPFAPSVLRSAVREWFEQDADVPFMMQVFQIKQDKRALIPAVTHVDGSGRLQTVSPEHNPRYHRLIEAFYALTQVPMVLNTSFNENEPVVCKPEEALDCFLRTRMDVLVLGDYLIRRDTP
jgi:carbamoyltransferase